MLQNSTEVLAVGIKSPFLRLGEKPGEKGIQPPVCIGGDTIGRGFVAEFSLCCFVPFRSMRDCIGYTVACLLYERVMWCLELEVYRCSCWTEDIQSTTHVPETVCLVFRLENQLASDSGARSYPPSFCPDS